MAIQEGTEQEQEESPRAKARAARRAKSTRTKTPRTPSPTRAIEPGPVHFKAAQVILETVKSRAQEKGIELDVGKFPSVSEAASNGDDPEQVARLLAHAVARVGDRFRFLRRFSRHLEGKEKRAGILSDLFSALWALYKRNPDAAEEVARKVATEVQQQRATREKSQTQPGGNPQ